jgi:hypothetical protein
VNHIEEALAMVIGEQEPLRKHLLLAALCTKIFAEREVHLVVVGGSAIEFYTEGAYMSGDVDLCVAKAHRHLTLRDRQELMGKLKGAGGPRSWEVAGIFVDILGSFENLAVTRSRRIETPLGHVDVAPIEELVVERILVAKYPSEYPPALDCARKLIASALEGEAEIDWKEVLRLARLAAYDNETMVKNIIEREAEALGLRSPYNTDE